MMSVLGRLFFNLWYFQKPPWDTGISPPELLDFIQSHPAGRALDLGCGTGTNLITLAQHGWSATGVDFVGRAIAHARKKAQAAGVKVNLYVDDVTLLEKITGPFDLILDMGCLHNLSAAGIRAYLENLERLLGPGGYYLLYAFFNMDGESGMGLRQVDVETLSRKLELVSRQDGTERGLRKSAWFTFRRRQP